MKRTKRRTTEDVGKDCMRTRKKRRRRKKRKRDREAGDRIPEEGKGGRKERGELGGGSDH